MTISRSLTYSLGILATAMTIAWASSPARRYLLATEVSPPFSEGCLPPGRIATDISAELISLMSRSDDLANKILASRGVLRVPTTQIAVVSDTTLCRRAANAYSSVEQLPATNRLVYTIRAGIRYLVLDPSVTAGEWKRGVTFDSSFTQVVGKFRY